MPELSHRQDDELRRQVAERRERLAADSILENENLTADLEDEAAAPLLDWGADWAKRIARSTAGLDDDQAEEAMSERMRATRQMMRSIDQWVADRESMAMEDHAGRLAQVAEQAAAAYGEGFAPPEAARCQAFLEQVTQFSGDPAQMVIQLNSLFKQPQ
jgi:gamma-glutamylcysteine synthetase